MKKISALVLAVMSAACSSNSRPVDDGRDAAFGSIDRVSAAVDDLPSVAVIDAFVPDRPCINPALGKYEARSDPPMSADAWYRDDPIYPLNYFGFTIGADQATGVYSFPFSADRYRWDSVPVTCGQFSRAWGEYIGGTHCPTDGYRLTGSFVSATEVRGHYASMFNCRISREGDFVAIFIGGRDAAERRGTPLRFSFVIIERFRYSIIMTKIKFVKQRKVAVFDIDGTIFRSSLLVELTDALIAEKLMTADTAKIFARARAKWMDRQGSYDDYIEDVVKAFMSRIKGVSRNDFLRVSARVVARSGGHVYRFTRDLIRDLRKRGYFLLAISNSPKEILDEFCKKWGFDMVYGRIYETDARGRLTDRILYFDLITDKEKILKRAVAKHGLTLKGSVGVGDSETDAKFLRLVDHPICFNPNAKLFAAAKRRGWKTVVERKDVIYSIN